MLPRVLCIFYNQRFALRAPVTLLDFFFSQFQVSIRITFQNSQSNSLSSSEFFPSVMYLFPGRVKYSAKSTVV